MLNYYLRNNFKININHYPISNDVIKLSEYTLIGTKIINGINYKVCYSKFLILSYYIDNDILYIRIVPDGKI